MDADFIFPIEGASEPSWMLRQNKAARQVTTTAGGAEISH